MNILHWSTVVVIGFVGCAEFGSVVFVHPVLRKLDAEHWITVERGLLRTFGLVMPVGMTAAPILAGSTAASLNGTRATIALAATALLVIALVVTVTVNVPINLATGGWDPHDLPDNWREQRRRWEQAQGVRGTLQFVGFVTIAAALS